MKKLFVLAAVALVATSAHAGEMKWYGGADWRYDQTKYDDQIGSTSSTANTNSQQTVYEQAIKANLGVTGGWENVDYGIGLRTQSAINNSYVNLSGSDLSVGIDQAFVKYSHDFSVLDLGVTLGRQKNIFAYEGTSQLLFSVDDRFNGLGWSFKLGSFGLNAAQYVLGSDTGSTSKITSTNYNAANISMLYGFQPYLNWRFTDEIDAFLGVGYFAWDNMNTSTTGNTGNGGYNSSTYNTNALAAGTLAIGSMHQWQFTTNINLPYSFALGGEYVTNKAGQYYTGGTVAAAAPSDNSAWTAGLTYGKVKKAHDWSLAYYYGSKGIDSVLSSYSNYLFPADNKGHIIEAKYNIADNFHVGADALFLKAKSNMNGYGALYSSNTTGTAQQEKSSYWEINAGVAF